MHILQSWVQNWHGLGCRGDKCAFIHNREHENGNFVNDDSAEDTRPAQFFEWARIPREGDCREDNTWPSTYNSASGDGSWEGQAGLTKPRREVKCLHGSTWKGTHPGAQTQRWTYPQTLPEIITTEWFKKDSTWVFSFHLHKFHIWSFNTHSSWNP